MRQRQLKVMIATFPYGGVGASSLETPDIRHWETRNVLWMSKDKRVQPFDDWLPGRDYIKIADTPISMTRNQSVVQARAAGADVLVMIDSDMRADCEFGIDPAATPFLPTAFNFLYNHWEKGPVVLAAPYCGASPTNNVFAFHWDSDRNPREDILNLKLQQYSRHEAYQLAGIQPIAAVGTGLMMFDMRIFDLLPPPWFYYTFDAEHTRKLATEDCTFTRDIAMLGYLQLGYEPLLCCWSSWAGHWKPELIRKPQPMTSEMINDKFKQGVISRLKADERIQDERATFVIERNIKLPTEAAEGQLGTAEWKFLGYSDGAMQIAGDFIDPKAKERLVEEHGVDYAMRRAGYEPVTPEPPDSAKPDNWNALLMEAPQIPVLLKLIKASKPRGRKRPRVLELGSWVGRSAVLMSDQADADVTCVDHFQGVDEREAMAQIAKSVGGSDVVKREFLKNVGKRLGKSIKLIEKKSGDAVGDVADKAFDLVWVDADHSFDGCTADIENYTPKVRQGGILAGHDFEHATVGQAVRTIFGNKAKVEHGIWSVRVTKQLAARVAAAANRRRKALPAVPKVAPVHKKVVRKRHNTLSRMPTGRSRVPGVGSGGKGKSKRPHAA